MVNRRVFFGKAFAAIVGASFLSFDDSDGLYPFQREGIEYLRKKNVGTTVRTVKIYAPYVPLWCT